MNVCVCVCGGGGGGGHDSEIFRCYLQFNFGLCFNV